MRYEELEHLAATIPGMSLLSGQPWYQMSSRQINRRREKNAHACAVVMQARQDLQCRLVSYLILAVCSMVKYMLVESSCCQAETRLRAWHRMLCKVDYLGFGVKATCRWNGRGRCLAGPANHDCGSGI